MDCTPEMRRVELQPGDFAIVLASDGLWDVLSDTEVVTILQKVSTPCPKVFSLTEVSGTCSWAKGWDIYLHAKRGPHPEKDSTTEYSSSTLPRKWHLWVCLVLLTILDHAPVYP